MSSSVLRGVHPTQFIYDSISSSGDPVTLQDFMKEEANYDISYVLAMGKVISIIDSRQMPTGPENLLAALDRIQDAAVSHLSDIRTPPDYIRYFRGRAFTCNWWGFSKSHCAEEAGLKNLIRDIWVRQIPLELVVHTDNKDCVYVLTKSSFIKVDLIKGSETLQDGERNHRATLEKIYEIILPIFEQGFLPNGSERFVVFNKESREAREGFALTILSNYFKKIEKAVTDEEIIKTIASTIQKLLQWHLYWEGNARSLFLLANLLLHQNGQPFFYASNMCIFDVNSTEKMYAEILEGQQRFAEYFTSMGHLQDSLQQYREAIIELQKLVNKHVSESPTAKEAMRKRDLNALFRKSAISSAAFPVFEFLFKHASILNVDIHSEGTTSGNALKIATQANNNKAIDLLTRAM